jgi:lysophospholipase L1-like esterase
LLAWTAAALLLLAGCGDPESLTPQEREQADTVRLVFIGDSLLDAGACAGCTGFVEQYAERLSDQIGRPTSYDIVAAAGVPDAQQAVAGDPVTMATIADADVVVVEVGYNNALPDPETGIGCGGSLAAGYVAWLRSTTPACLAQGVATYAGLYDQVLTGIQQLRDGRPTIFVLTNTINGNIDPDRPGLVSEVAERDRPFTTRWVLAAYERWNAMLLERAATAGFTHVDLWHAFNGPDGSRPLGELSADGAHPSQQGHDLIAGLLAEVDVSALSDT